jgi:hypothetical protein
LFFKIFIIILLLNLGYIVTFTKVLTKNSFRWVLGGEREGAEWVVREALGARGEK